MLSFPLKQKSLITLHTLLSVPLFLLLLTLIVLYFPLRSFFVAHAATITVNTTNDELNSDGDCSLREAIQAANTDTGVDACTAGSGDDIISLPAGIYVLSLTGADEDNNVTGDLDIVDNLIINGAGAANTAINGGGIDRVLHNFSGGHTEINGVTISNGSTTIWGGGIYNAGGTLTLNNSSVSDNTAGGSGAGGGILNNSGTLTLNNSRVSGNTADYGGGIHNVWASATLTLNNSTVSGNTAGGKGGGISNYYGTLTLTDSTVNGNTTDGDTEKNRGGGGIFSLLGTVALTDSTVSGNTVATVGGGGIHNYGGTLTLNNVTIANNVTQTGDGGGINNLGVVNLKNTIVAGNTDVAGGEAPDCSGTLTTQGYNIIGNNTGCTFTSTTGDQVGIDPLLGPLQDNGGNSFTHALLTGSPAIDAGNPAAPGSGGNACAATDQRGRSRPMDGNNDGADIFCDIGAYEVSGPLAPTPTTTPGSPTPTITPLPPTATPTSTPGSPTSTPMPKFLYIPLVCTP